MASQDVQLTDARHATFYDVRGNQYISVACEPTDLVFNSICLLSCQRKTVSSTNSSLQRWMARCGRGVLRIPGVTF
jgi:hypothetical protein